MNYLGLYYKLQTIFFLKSSFCSATTELTIENQDGSTHLQVKTLESCNLKKELDSLKQGTESCEKELVIKLPGNLPEIVQKVDRDQAQNNDLIKKFRKLNAKTLKISKFYFFFDLLTIIDKTIALIDKFLWTPKINESNTRMIIGKTRLEIISRFYTYYGLKDEVSKLVESKTDELSQSRFEYIKKGLIYHEKYIKKINDQFKKYKNFRITEYEIAITMKSFKLIGLRNCLLSVKNKLLSYDKSDGKILLMSEKSMKEHSELLRTRFKTIVSKIYEKLDECHKKEKENLKWLVEVFFDVLKDLNKCIADLESFKKDLSKNEKNDE